MGVVKEITQATNLERYGSKSPSGNAEVQARIVGTNLATYGVRRPTMSPKVQLKQVETSLKNNGVPYGCLTSRCREETMSSMTVMKRHLTMKEAGSYRKSKAEDEFYDLLCSLFGDENVERQRSVSDRRWSIDFYVNSIDTYVQFDGAYWHGLDRRIDEIAEHRTKRDIVIEETFNRDKRQVAWFLQNDLRLVRVTDAEFKADPRSCLLKIVGDHDVTSLHHTQGNQLHL